MNGGNRLLLSPRDRRLLLVLGVLLGALLVYLLFLVAVEKPSLARAERELVKRQEAGRKVAAERDKKKAEWQMWKQGLLDLKEVRANWFYQEAEGYRPFLTDVRQILSGAAIEPSQFNYNYDDIRGEKIQRVSVTFTCSCSYFMLKRLLDDVERFPKFLMLERLDFLKTPDQGQTLEFSVTIMGYYARS
jgi:cell division protein FtsB